MQRLRLWLPRLRDLRPDTPMAYALVDRDRRAPGADGRGAGNAGIEPGEQAMTLMALAQRWPGARIDALLHPADATLMDLPLPPLPPARMRTAVSGAIEAFLLGDTASVMIAYGTRGADGLVPVAWVDREAMDDAKAALQEHGLTLRAAYPSPFFLPCVDQAWTAWCVDGYVAMRQGRDRGHQLLIAWNSESDAGMPSAQSIEALVAMLDDAPSVAVNWVGAVPSWWPEDAPRAAVLPPDQRGTGALPPWSLALDDTAPRAQGRAWAGAGACMALAVAVWVVGLNLYSYKLQRAGEGIEAHVNQRVKETFPELRAVIEPLRQARQQRQARQDAGGSASTGDFAFLMQSARRHMAFAQGQIQAVRFDGTALEVELMPGASGMPAMAPASPGAPKPARTATAKPVSSNTRGSATAAGATPAAAAAGTSPPWVADALKDGVAVEPIEHGWKLRRAPPVAAVSAATRAPAPGS